MDKILEAPICERGNDLIAFLYGEIDEHAARDFERHLLNCAECESELGAFKQIRSSVGAWRQESLGAATATSVAASPAVGRASDLEKPSAITAIRKFFEISPLWVNASIAFASVLFCVVSVLALAHLFENRRPVVVGDEKRYTEKELQAKIEDAVKSRRQDREARNGTPLPSVAANNNQQVKPQRRGANGTTGRVATNPKVRRAPLTKSEREQLAADLRLKLPQDDTDLDLLSDGINQ
ncbi:MAG: zf-HC2 domain-containing protein [Pyrinomonadaceae bacterium]|nr:zf-HC2 domain-containing protein [Pyrinomonadaceae bacterium]